MGILSITEENNCKIALWEITETLDKLLQLSHTISIPDFNTEKRKKEWLASRLLLNKWELPLAMKEPHRQKLGWQYCDLLYIPLKEEQVKDRIQYQR